jgi:hypothetical protein
MAKLYQRLATLVQARETCAKNDNKEWHERHTIAAEALVRAHMPRGSGFDNGTHLDLGESTTDKLVFRTAFHHMDANGFYDGWTEHKVIVRPSLQFDFYIRITGLNRDGVWKDYAHESFDLALRQEVQ